MKKKLLFAALLMGGCLSASAQWNFPEPVTQGFSIAEGAESTDTLYLYNVGAHAYFTEGNDWGTRASTASWGLKVYFQKFLEAPEDGEEGAEPVWDGKTYLIYDFSLAKNAWKNLFIDSATALYVDLGSQSNFYFSVLDNGNGTFKIYGAERNPAFNPTEYPNSYLGVEMTTNTDGKVTISDIINPTLDPESATPGTNEFYTDWAFVNKENYEAQQTKVAQYEAAVALGDAIARAEAKNIDVAAEKAVYNNTNSTKEELDAATVSVNTKIASNIEDFYSPDNPLNMDADYVVNTTFDNTEGWTTNTGAQNTGTATNKTAEAGRDGLYHFTGSFWENWNGSAFTGKLYKQMTQMPKGVYYLRMAAFCNSGEGSYVYLNNDSVEVTYGSPETYELFALVEESDTVEIGLKVVSGGNNWVGIDNVHLEYYGNKASSFAYYFQQRRAIDFSHVGEFYQKAAKDEFDNAVNSILPATPEEAVAALDTYNAAWEVFSANAAAYEALNKAYQIGEATLDEGFEDDDLSDYIMDIPDLLEEGEMTTEEALAMTKKVEELTEAARRKYKEGQDITSLITNANFDQSGSIGWLVDTKTVNNAYTSGPAVAGLPQNQNGERWNNNFDYYQTLTGLQNGVYELKAQAFYRTGSNADAWSQHTSESEEILAWIYINDNKAAVPSIMEYPRTEAELAKGVANDGQLSTVTGNCYSPGSNDDGVTIYTPNGQNSASAFFSIGDYECNVYGIVTDGNLRLGIKSEGSVSDRWTLFDNFRLVFQGYNEDVLVDLLNAKSEEAAELLESTMAKDAFNALEEAYNLAGEAAASGEGRTMFNALNTIIAAINAGNESLKQYEELRTQLQNLEAAFNEYAGTASVEAANNAEALMNEVSEALEAGTYTDAEVAAKIDEIKGAITDLKVPAEKASDDNPIDYTQAIVNPSFDVQDDFTGWAGSGWGAGGTKSTLAERYQMNFDTYQDLNVPEGTYMLSVNGMHRSGWAADDYAAYLAQQEKLAEDPNYADPTLTAFLYATTSEGTYSVALPHASAGNVEGAYGVTNEDNVASGIYIPGTMLACDTYFHTPYTDAEGNEYYPYNVSVILKVGADKKLRIGVKRVGEANDKPAGNWTIVDDFQLICYGTESAKTPSDDASGIEGVQTDLVKAAEIFNVNGARVATLQKGINIVRMSNGTIQKILVK